MKHCKLQGMYQPECPPSVHARLSPEEASACLHTLPCTPVTQGRCGPAGGGGRGGMRQEGTPKREALGTSPLAFLFPTALASHMHTAWHPGSLVRRGIWEAAVQRASRPPEMAVGRSGQRCPSFSSPALGPVEVLLREVWPTQSCPFQTERTKFAKPND